MLVVQLQGAAATNSIVFPTEFSAAAAEFPVPSWAQRACAAASSDCRGHGDCDRDGQCQCDASYYGEYCEHACIGGYVDASGDYCLRDKTFYIGMAFDFNISVAAESKAVLQLAAALVNNKTDGWFDNLPHVYLAHRVNDSKCLKTGAEGAAREQSEWARSEGATLGLDAIIGDVCLEGRSVGQRRKFVHDIGNV